MRIASIKISEDFRRNLNIQKRYVSIKKIGVMLFPSLPYIKKYLTDFILINIHKKVSICRYVDMNVL